MFPTVWNAYANLGQAVADAGPLDERTRRLLKLALARQALEEGLAPKELRQVTLLAITTLGFPAAMAGACWVEDELKKTAEFKN
jgi:alkylhydroperoxidase/carboxymuconolactone decarboxylase family protein YurZ